MQSDLFDLSLGRILTFNIPCLKKINQNGINTCLCQMCIHGAFFGFQIFDFRFFSSLILDLEVVIEEEKMGIIPFNILSQGLLTEKYITGVPLDSRAGNPDVPFLNKGNITPELVNKLERLKEIANKRNQSMAEMAVSWTIFQKGITSTLIGVSKLSQLTSNLHALENTVFTKEELEKIEKIVRNY